MSGKTTVLIVEDDRTIREDILSLIDWEDCGFRVVATAANGRQGIAAFRQYHPDLVIADIQMPVMDGLTMLREIRNEDSSVSFIILSAFAEFEYAKEAVRLSTDAYLLKNELSRDALLEVLFQTAKKITDLRNMKRFASRHRLFEMFSSCVDSGPVYPVPPEEISSAFSDYVNSTGDLSVCRQDLEHIIKDCYNILGLIDRVDPCPKGGYSDMEIWLLHEYKNLCSMCSLINDKKYSPVIINAIEYIAKNYGNSKLKINMVAEHIGLSPGRLSVIFKQELGVTVNEYITNLRISEAKKLLKSGKYRVYEVAEMVGYKTSQYFSQVFFQKLGKYPTDYLRGKEK
ncbi:MAG: response regulator transcription factor [Oscillospiraceae bacterium]|jgi:two-component system response regulator YesN